MKNLLIIFVIAFLTSSLTISGQNYSRLKERDKAEKNTGKFAADYWKSANNKHLAFQLRFTQDSSLQIIDVQERTGKMPHKSDKSGKVQILYTNNNNKILGSYFDADPLIIRSCDGDRENIKTILVGTTIEILTPYLKDITSIEIKYVSGKKVFQNKVDQFMKKLR